MTPQQFSEYLDREIADLESSTLTLHKQVRLLALLDVREKILSIEQPDPISNKTQLDIKMLAQFKLPVKYLCGFIFDANNQVMMEGRGWGHLQYSDDAEEIQDHLGEMFANAFNDKYPAPSPVNKPS